MPSLPETPKTQQAISDDDLSSYEYVFVKYSSDSTDAKKKIELCASGQPCGILQTGKAAGISMSFVPLNGQWAKLTASAAISTGDKVGPTTGGQGVTVSSNTNSYYFIADSAATAGDDVIVGYTAIGTISA